MGPTWDDLAGKEGIDMTLDEAVSAVTGFVAAVDAAGPA